MTSHLTIPGSLEWDSPEVERLTIATLRYAGGLEHNVRYVSEVHYDTVRAERDALQQRLTVAEKRAGELEAAAQEMLRVAGIANQGSRAYTRAIINLNAALKPVAEVKS